MVQVPLTKEQFAHFKLRLMIEYYLLYICPCRHTPFYCCSLQPCLAWWLCHLSLLKVPFTDGWCMLVSILPFCSSTPQQSDLPSEIQHSDADTGAVFVAIEISFLFTTLWTRVNRQSWALLVKVKQFKLLPALVRGSRSSPFSSSSSFQHHKTAVSIIQNHLPIDYCISVSAMADWTAFVG
jgi:hypothetical protein